MSETTLSQWQRWRAEGCTRLPFALTLPGETLPATWEGLAQVPEFVVLESAQAGRYTYICDAPDRVIVGLASDARVRVRGAGGMEQTWSGTPLEILSRALAERCVPVLTDTPVMSGGMIGLLGYDAVHAWERLPMRARRDLPVPLYAFIEPAVLFVYDHEKRVLTVIAWRDVPAGVGNVSGFFEEAGQLARAAVERWRANAKGASGRRPGSASPATSEPPLAASSVPPGEFEAAVRRVLDYIAAGDTYQVNLSRRTSRATRVPAERVYAILREINPSPYMGLMKLPEFALVCGSPELLVKAVDERIVSRPIAGTRRRGERSGEDADLSAELFASEKERAEHLMLVDLIRNDIGRVAAYGSVQVTEFMVLERYSHVMHIVSQVEGRRREGVAWAEIVQAMFPGGTITGCPKVRTMEIIEELEPVGRGFYTGAMGWVSYAGELELNIVIRSMLLQDGVAHVQAGAGIVADSQPERELDEATRKAQALWMALDRAETT